jgi:hypothetical protein
MRFLYRKITLDYQEIKFEALKGRNKKNGGALKRRNMWNALKDFERILLNINCKSLYLV